MKILWKRESVSIISCCSLLNTAILKEMRKVNEKVEELLYSYPSVAHWHLEEMSLPVSGIGQIDLTSKSQLRHGKLMMKEKWAGELMRRKLPSALLHYCFQTVTLAFLWFEANYNHWFNVVFIFGAVCGFACCVHFLNLVHDIGKAKPACKPEISHNNSHI